MVDKLKQMHWKKILLIGEILMVAFVAGLCVQKPEGIKPTPLQPAEELKLSDFPEAFKSTLIVVGDNASEIEMQAVNEIAEYLENETGNKPLIKKHSEISDEDKRSYNLIVVGTPKTNPLFEEVYALTDATRVTEEFPGEGKGVLEILPNPWDEEKVMLSVEGWEPRSVIIYTSKQIEKLEIPKLILPIQGVFYRIPSDPTVVVYGFRTCEGYEFVTDPKIYRSLNISDLKGKGTFEIISPAISRGKVRLHSCGLLKCNMLNI